MKKYQSSVIQAALSLLSLVAGMCVAADIQVAPSGGDTGDGSAAKPLATLVRARDAARAAGRGPNRIILAAGTYRLRETLELDQRDNGLTILAAPGAEARICGSIAVPAAALRPVDDPVVVARLPQAVRAVVCRIDLRALGIADLGAIGPHGFRRPYIPAPIELVQDDRILGLARWPKDGTPGEPLGKVLDKGPVTRNGQKPTRGGTFTLTSDRALGWADPGQVWITGFFANGYADDLVQIKAIDREKHTLTTVQPHMYGFSSGGSLNRWTAVNVLEELSQPGECVLDHAAGCVYLIPWTPPTTATRLEATVLDRPLIAIEGATGVTITGVILENSRQIGVYIERGARNRVTGCTLRNLGMVAVCIGKGVTPDSDYRMAFTG